MASQTRKIAVARLRKDLSKVNIMPYTFTVCGITFSYSLITWGGNLLLKVPKPVIYDTQTTILRHGNGCLCLCFAFISNLNGLFRLEEIIFV